MVFIILILGLLIPRTALIIGYCLDSLLANTVPFFMDFLLTLIAPRLLFIIYIMMNYENVPHPNFFIVAHIILIIYEYEPNDGKKIES